MVQDGSESDVDCGGDVCAPCGTGLRCDGLDANCVTKVCRNNICAPPDLACTNGKQDQQETDIDCGGPTCPGCAPGKKCLTNGDCFFNQCLNGICGF
jgi:hypothetical protein